MKKLVLCCLLAVGAWASCKSEAREYEQCIEAYTKGYGYCKNIDGYGFVQGRNVTAEMVNRARLELDACIARQMSRGY